MWVFKPLYTSSNIHVNKIFHACTYIFEAIVFYFATLNKQALLKAQSRALCNKVFSPCPLVSPKESLGDFCLKVEKVQMLTVMRKKGR